MNYRYQNFITRFIVCICLWVATTGLNTVFAQSVTITCTGTAGSFNSGSTTQTTKNDGNLINLNTTTSGANIGTRGWATFNLSTVPASAIITGASVDFVTYSSTASSSTANEVHGFSGDPASLTAVNLWNAIGGLGTNVVANPSSWAANGTNTVTLNAAGVNYLRGSLASGKANLGFLRGSTNNYNISGYPATNGAAPVLTVTYTIPTAAPNCATGLFPANNAVNVATNGRLSWNAAANAATYDVYFGTATNPPLVASVGDTLYNFSPNLAQNTVYHYRIVPKNNLGTATGCSTLSFRTIDLPLYCALGSSNCTLDDEILNVKFGSINNSSADCSGAGFSDYTGTVTPANVAPGQIVPISVTIAPGGNENVGVWIDFNRNGVFETSEFKFIGNTAGGVLDNTINVPAGASIGAARMRIRVRNASALTDADACTTITFGETEDYLINIANCQIPTAAVTSGDTTICAGSTANLRVTGGSLGDATSWRWYTTSCGGTAAGTGTSLAVTPTATTTYYVRGEGGCVTPGTCTQVVVTVNAVPGAPIINTVPSTCLGTPRALVINPFTFDPTPIPDSITLSSSATLNLAIPDNTANGVSTTLSSNLPAGSQITGLDVTLNMPHTYPGDMIIHLVAPNGQIFNLYKYNGGTFTGNAGVSNAGWFNAVISSTGNIGFSAVPSPYRYGITAPVGRFRADAINADVAGPTVQNPVGFVSNAANFAALYSQANGTWTLALADGGPADLGTLTNWSLKIRFNRFAQIPSTPAVWSPAATLYADAAATVPYDGTSPLFTVYAKPNSTTTYTAKSVRGTCESAPTTATVTIIDSVIITRQPTSQVTCEFGTTQLTVAASGTTPTYQWFSRSGTTNTALTNGDNYAGVDNDTLTIKNAQVSFSNLSYFCIVTSALPCTTSKTSASTTIKVNRTPVASLVASPFTSLLPGLTSTLTASADSTIASYQWFSNNTELAGITAATYPVNVDRLGNYSVRIIDVNGCSHTSPLLAITDSLSSRLFVYPNPNQGQFQVRYHSALGNSSLPRMLAIYDAKGALVMTQTYTIGKPYDRMDVDFRNLSKGVYAINLLDRNGKRLAHGKVIIQ
jgi:subtilisin-like proprotein convertase family protein